MSSRSPDFSRRDAFKILGVTGAAVALSGRVGRAETSAASATMPQGAGFYRTHVGEFEVTIVSDGQFPLVPYPTFGSNASKEAVEAVLKENFIDPAKLMGQVNGLVIRMAGGPVTIVDTGCGKLFGPASGFYLQNLQNAGVKPADVQNVLFTHLHPDHCGGAVTEDGKPVYANAKHHVHKREVGFWTVEKPDFSKSGVPAEAQGGMIATAKKAITAPRDNLELFDGESTEILPGITALKTGGHTPGHCMVQIESGGDRLLYVTDMVVQAQLVFAHPEWFVGFDTDMQATVKIRQDLFAKLAADGTLICGSHLPFPSLGHVKKVETGYQFVPAMWNWA